MTDRLEVKKREHLRRIARMSCEERVRLERDFYEYFVTARPLRPPNLRGNPLRSNQRYLRVYKFLWSKGYFNDFLPPLCGYRKNIGLEDLLWVAENVDERIYQLLPAIVIRFPLHLKKIVWIPDKLGHVIQHLRSGEESGPNYEDYPFELLRSWMWFRPRDVRCYKVQGRRLSVRLDPVATLNLERYCDRMKITRTEAIHLAVARLKE